MKKMSTEMQVILTFVFAILFGLSILVPICLCGFTFRVWTDKQVAAHEIAEQARAAGFDDDSEIIQACSAEWWADYENMEIVSDEEDNVIVIEDAQVLDVAYKYAGISWEDYCSLCNMVEHEAGDGCSLEHKMAVAKVCMNRVNRSDFPDSVTEVLIQPKQYSGRYITDNLMGISSETLQAVDDVLYGVDNMPDDIIWQANFPQGVTWKAYYVDTGWFRSTTYIGKAA